MCGISGIFAYRDSAPPVDREELLRVREAMIKRGPDGAGLWVSNDTRAGLAHRRLSIIDLSDAGAQPMSTPDAMVTVTFNGEIYNFRALRGELEAKGYRFGTNTDTEVLLWLYEDRGAEMVHALRGMYAFAIWDERKKGLFLARDPFGIKPLYYSDDGRSLRFASQAKALLKGGNVDTREEPAGYVGFFVWGSIPEPYTLYKGIRAVPAGSTVWVGAAGPEPPKSFFSVCSEYHRAADSPIAPGTDYREYLAEAVRDSIRHHLVSDVPVGVFLSAGLDSSTIASHAASVSDAELHALTLGFAEFKGTHDDEVPMAQTTARELGLRHHVRWIRSEEFEHDMQELLDAMDQPSIDGVNTYFVSKAAAEAGMKVALSGLGGDELFGGYPSFRQVPALARGLAWARGVPALGRWLRRITAPLVSRLTSPKYAGLLEYGSSFAGAYLLRRSLFMPWELADFLDRDMFAQGWQELRSLDSLEASIGGLASDRLKVSALEIDWYMRNQLLRDADWAGMAHSIEIRVPLVDVTLFRQLAPLLAARNPPRKIDLARTPENPLPPALLTRSKTGFLVPVRAWLSKRAGSRSVERGLRGWAHTVLPYRARFRILSLITDAFGGRGGIALYGRDVLSALCNHPGAGQVVAIPRLMPDPPEQLPERLSYLTGGLGGRLNYVLAIVGLLMRDRRFDLIVCGHINLMPLAYLASRVIRAPIVLFIYGIDAWNPTDSRVANCAARRAARVVSISRLTATKFLSWSGVPSECVDILPNAIHAEWYGTGPRSETLLSRHGLHARTVILTIGRLVSAERYKGFDEVLEVLGDLSMEVPNISYLIVGDGSDRERLEGRVSELGLRDRVRFAGYIAESEKAEYFRLADAYVMPSRGEGFGFVLLEAMACGIPVVASKVDGGREALSDGALGTLVEPSNREELKHAVLEALKRPREIPKGLEHFSYEKFELRCHRIIDGIL